MEYTPIDRRYRLTVRDFLTLDEAGVFDEVGRVELIEGEIFVMAPLHIPHGTVHANLVADMTFAVRTLGEPLRVATPVSAALDPHSLPEADIVIFAGADPADELITAPMVRLMAEVSASSLAYDLGRKLRLYARTGVPEYWVVDVRGKRIIRFHTPAGEDYAERAEFAFGEPVPSATISGLTVDTARLA